MQKLITDMDRYKQHHGDLYQIEPGYPLQMLMWERRYFPMRNGIKQIVVKCWRNIGVTA